MENTKRYRATGLGDLLTAQGRRRDWLAQQSNVSSGLVTHLLKGRRTVSAEVAARMASVLGVPLFLAFELSDDGKSDSSESAESDALVMVG